MDFNDAVYEDEVSEFYTNLDVNADSELTSIVNNIEFSVSLPNLALLYGVPHSGFADYTSQAWPFVLGVDNATISRIHSDQPLPHAQIFLVFMLSAKFKLLRNLITKTLLPHVENRGDCLIMDMIKSCCGFFTTAPLLAFPISWSFT